MAGSYADPTTWRMALDRDGSKIVRMSEAGTVLDVAGSDVQKVVDDSTGTMIDAVNGFGGGIQKVYWIGVVFPELRDIDGYALFTNNSGVPWTVEVSVNTTNGQDGTWSQINSTYNSLPTTANWRTSMTAGTALAVRGIRFRGGPYQTMSLLGLHLYGEVAPGENPDRLVMWAAGADTKMPPATLDWGNVPRSSSDDRQVRVKNVSTSKSANSIRVSFDILTDGAPTVPGQHLVSYNGGAFLAQVNIGSLGPGAISGIITIRRVTPSNAQLGLFSPRVSAVADTFA